MRDTQTHHIPGRVYRTYPFPSLSLGAVVAVTTCTPSGHHSNWVESLAYIKIVALTNCYNCIFTNAYVLFTDHKGMYTIESGV